MAAPDLRQRRNPGAGFSSDEQHQLRRLQLFNQAKYEARSGSSYQAAEGGYIGGYGSGVTSSNGGATGGSSAISPASRAALARTRRSPSAQAMMLPADRRRWQQEEQQRRQGGDIVAFDTQRGEVTMLAAQGVSPPAPAMGADSPGSAALPPRPAPQNVGAAGRRQQAHAAVSAHGEGGAVNASVGSGGGFGPPGAPLGAAAAAAAAARAEAGGNGTARAAQQQQQQQQQLLHQLQQSPSGAPTGDPAIDAFTKRIAAAAAREDFEEAARLKRQRDALVEAAAAQAVAVEAALSPSRRPQSRQKMLLQRLRLGAARLLQQQTASSGGGSGGGMFGNTGNAAVALGLPPPSSASGAAAAGAGATLDSAEAQLRLGSAVVALLADDDDALSCAVLFQQGGLALLEARVQPFGSVGHTLYFGGGGGGGGCGGGGATPMKGFPLGCSRQGRAGKVSRQQQQQQQQQQQPDRLRAFDVGDSLLHLAARNGAAACTRLLLRICAGRKPAFNGVGRQAREVAAPSCRSLFDEAASEQSLLSAAMGGGGGGGGGKGGTGSQPATAATHTHTVERVAAPPPPRQPQPPAFAPKRSPKPPPSGGGLSSDDEASAEFAAAAAAGVAPAAAAAAAIGASLPQSGWYDPDAAAAAIGAPLPQSGWHDPDAAAASASASASASAAGSETSGSGARATPDDASPDDEAAAAGVLQSRYRSACVRAEGVEYERSLGAGRLGMVVHAGVVTTVSEGGQASAQRVLVGSQLLAVNGKRAGSDEGIARLLATEPRPLRLKLHKPGSKPRPPPAEVHAASVLQARIRGAKAREKGIEYSVEVGEGPLGLEVVNLIVTATMPGGQSARLGVLTGSRVLSLNGRAVTDDVGFASLLSVVPRPFRLCLGKVRTPRAKAGALFVLSGSLASGRKWKERAVAVEVSGADTVMTIAKAGEPAKASKKRAPLVLASWDVESPPDDLLVRRRPAVLPRRARSQPGRTGSSLVPHRRLHRLPDPPPPPPAAAAAAAAAAATLANYARRRATWHTPTRNSCSFCARRHPRPRRRRPSRSRQSTQMISTRGSSSCT